MSAGGFIDDTPDERLLLSNDADFDRVDGVCAETDAIMIGAETLRRDSPRLLVNSAERRTAREVPPLKVTITASGDLDPDLKFWHRGGGKVVYAPDPAADKARARLGDLADVLADLVARGVG